MNSRPPLFFDDEQLALLSQEEMGGALFSEEERKGIYTGERLKVQRPKLFEAAVRMLADPTISYRRITQATGLHHYTLQAVERSNPELIEAAKERVKADLAAVATKSLDLVKENLDKVEVKTTTDLQKLTIVAAVAIEKHELLSGNATQRVARTEESLEDLQEHFAGLPDTAAAIDAEYTEITGYDGEPGDPKRDPGPGAGRPPGQPGGAS